MAKKAPAVAGPASDSLSAMMAAPAPSQAQCAKAMQHRRNVRRKIEDILDQAHKTKDPW